MTADTRTGRFEEHLQYVGAELPEPAGLYFGEPSNLVSIIAAAEQLSRGHEQSGTMLPTALIFLHRFYAVKSMQRNDRFIVACACLFLAAKVEDCPKALNDVAYQCYKQRSVMTRSQYNQVYRASIWILA